MLYVVEVERHKWFVTHWVSEPNRSLSFLGIPHECMVLVSRSEFCPIS
jgi:hypothetical protein